MKQLKFGLPVRRLLGALLLPLALAALQPAQAATNLVKDGSFNDFSRCYSCWNGSDGHTVDWGARMVSSWAQTDPNSTNFGPTQRYWTGGGITTYNLTASIAKGGWLNFYGVNEHLHGSITASPDGGSFIAGGNVQQSITGLVVGQDYAVSFYSAGAVSDAYEVWPWNYTNVVGTLSTKVTFGSSTQNGAVHAVTTSTSSPWTLNTLYFTATSATQLLSLSSQVLTTNVGAPPYTLLLDGVSVTAVPEPAQMAMFVVGLGLLGALRLRSRRQGR